jgi:hypothetical protein
MARKKAVAVLPEADKDRAKRNQNLMNVIIAETFVRHAELSEEDFKAEIGFKDSDKSEEEAVSIAMFNVMVEATKVFLEAEGKLNMMTGLLKACLEDEKIDEEIKDNE